MRSQYFLKGWELSHVRYRVQILVSKSCYCANGCRINFFENMVISLTAKWRSPCLADPVIWYCLLRAAGNNWWGRKSSLNKPPVYATLGSLFLNQTLKLKNHTFYYLSSIKQMTKSRRTQSVHQLWQGFVTWHRKIRAEERAAKWWNVTYVHKGV